MVVTNLSKSISASIVAAEAWLTRRVEVEIGEVHVSFGEDVHGKNILASGESHSNQCRCEVPVMPLAPGDGIGGIESGGNCERSGRVLTVHVERDCSAAI